MIRNAIPDDFDAIYTLCKKNGKLLGPVMPPEIRTAIANEQCLVFVDNGQVIAFVLFRRLKRLPECTVQVICVNSDYRGAGIGKQLIKYLLELYKVPIKATCIKDSTSEQFWSSVGTKYEELPGKVRPICRYKVFPKVNQFKSLF